MQRASPALVDETTSPPYRDLLAQGATLERSGTLVHAGPGDTDGPRMHVSHVRSGAQTDRLVVLVHGVMSDGSTWRFVEGPLGAGNDLLNGGGHADRFVFDAGHGSDTITGLQDNLDTIVISAGLAGTTSVATLLATSASQVGSSVEFDFGNGTDFLRLVNVTLADLSDDIQIV